MALNCVIIRKGLPSLVAHERILYSESDCSITLKTGDSGTYHGKGKLYLTNFRMIFMKLFPTKAFSSCSLPYRHIRQFVVKKQFFVEKSIQGVVAPVVDGGLNGESKFLFTFDDSAQTKTLFEKASQQQLLAISKPTDGHDVVTRTPSLPVELIFPDQFEDQANKINEKVNVNSRLSRPSSGILVASQSTIGAPICLTYNHKPHRAMLFPQGSKKPIITGPIKGASPVSPVLTSTLNLIGDDEKHNDVVTNDTIHDDAKPSPERMCDGTEFSRVDSHSITSKMARNGYFEPRGLLDWEESSKGYTNRNSGTKTATSKPRVVPPLDIFEDEAFHKDESIDSRNEASFL